MEESSYIHKSHNVTVLIYHLVTPAKYRKVIFDEELDEYLCKICEGIEDRYEIRFLEKAPCGRRPKNVDLEFLYLNYFILTA